MDSCQDVLARALISQQHLSYVYRETIYAPSASTAATAAALSAPRRLQHISRFSQLKVDGEQLERSGIRLTIALGRIFRFVVVVVVEHINRSLLSTRRLDSLEKPACAGPGG